MKLILKSACAVLTIALLTAQSSFAATQTATVSVNASVAGSLLFNISVNSVNPTTSAETATSSFNFGPLTNNGNGGKDAGQYFKVYFSVNSQSLPYTISQTGTTVSNGTTTLPNNACRVTPAFNSGSGNPGTLGTAGTWVGTRNIYTSNSTGSQAPVVAFYGLIGDPAQGAGNFIPETQASGNYSGTVTFTATA